MRDSSLRSHHSSALASGVKRPRIAKPSASSAASGTANSVAVRPSGRASASGADRPEPFQPAAYDLDKGFVARPRPLVIRRRDSERRRRFQLWPQSAKMREPLRRDPQHRSADIEVCGALLTGKLGEPAAPARIGLQLRRRSKSQATPRHRAIHRHFPPQAMLQTAPARWPQDRDGRDRRRPAAKSSGAPSQPGSGAPLAGHRRDRHMAAPTTLRARAATAASGRAR